jgi:hypothetical protein
MGQNDEQRTTTQSANSAVQDVTQDVVMQDAEMQEALDEDDKVEAGDVTSSSNERQKAAFQAENLLTGPRLRGYEPAPTIESPPGASSSRAIHGFISASNFTPVIRRAAATGDTSLGRPYNLENFRPSAVQSAAAEGNFRL